MASKHSTPLAKWLTRRHVTQSGFADLVTTLRGWRTTQAQVSRWVRGSVSLAGEAWIEQATRGEVTRRSWAAWRRAAAAVAEERARVSAAVPAVTP